MPVSYYDQFLTTDPGNPPMPGTMLPKSYLQAVDQNRDGALSTSGGDTIDGSAITASWPGDKITVVMHGNCVTIEGHTFYLEDGRSVFTPTDGTPLNDATFISASFAKSCGAMPVGALGTSAFVKGTTILTERGVRTIETLAVGDLVETVDSGLRPVSWVGRKSVRGLGDLAPVLFREGSIGNVNDLRVSPNHRILVTGAKAQQLCGRDEVLVPAEYLVDGINVVIEPNETVEYFHMVFDEHEVVFSDGAMTKSWIAADLGPQTNHHARADLQQLRPELFDDSDAQDETAAVSALRLETRVLTAA